MFALQKIQADAVNYGLRNKRPFADLNFFPPCVRQEVVPWGIILASGEQHISRLHKITNLKNGDRAETGRSSQSGCDLYS